MFELLDNKHFIDPVLQQIVLRVEIMQDGSCEIVDYREGVTSKKRGRNIKQNELLYKKIQQCISDHKKALQKQRVDKNHFEIGKEPDDSPPSFEIREYHRLSRAAHAS